MKKILKNLFLAILIFLTLQVLVNNYQVKISILNSIEIWKNNLFPNLFPFFILSELLINYGFSYYLSILLNRPFKILFNASGISSFVFILSMLSGFPSSAKYIKDLYDKELINDIEASKLLTFTHFSNPLFIIGFIGNIVGIKNSIIILISHYLTNIIIGIFFRNMAVYKESNVKFECKPFSIIFKAAIKNSIDTLLLILGTVTFFMTINTIINSLNINNCIKYFSSLFLEMTNAIKYIETLKIALNLKSILIVMVISFGGLSVHFQILSIISGTKIKYHPYLLARIIHALLSGMMVLIINMLI